jgi:hypothetical protein
MIRRRWLPAICLLPCLALALAGGHAAPAQAADAAPALRIEQVFPVQAEHAHGSTLVELPNGDLLVGGFKGSGERWADDVRILGARQRKGSGTWSAPFLLADVKEFPDCNPVLFLDPRGRLWLMWITIIANQWETSLVKYRISDDFSTTRGRPRGAGRTPCCSSRAARRSAASSPAIRSWRRCASN